MLRDALHARAEPLYRQWQQTLASLDPQLADELQRMRAGNMPEQWQAELPSFDPDAKGVASGAPKPR